MLLGTQYNKKGCLLRFHDTIKSMKTTSWLNYAFYPYDERRNFKNSFSVFLSDVDTKNQVASVKGSGKNNYTTTLFDCTCQYFFTHQNQPCKHMFALAKALGLIKYELQDLQKLDLYSYFTCEEIDSETRTNTVLNLLHENRVPTDAFVVYRFSDGTYAFGERTEQKTDFGKYRLALGLNCKKAFILGKNKNEIGELVYGVFSPIITGYPKSCARITTHRNGFTMQDFDPNTSVGSSIEYDNKFIRFCIPVYKKGQPTDKDIFTTSTEGCKIYFKLNCLPDKTTNIRYEVTPLFEISTTHEFFLPFYSCLANSRDEKNYYEFDVEDVSLD